jgi:AraC-like DNA-binding protein
MALSPSSPPAKAATKSVTPMAFVRAVLSAYDKYGVDPHGGLRAAGLTLAQTRKAHARVGVEQLEARSATARQELDDEALGWFSRRLPWGSYGLLCRASLGAATLEVALRRWCRHHALLTDDVTLALDVDRKTATLSLRDGKGSLALHELGSLTTLRYVHGYACWLLDSRLPLREVTFPFAAPAHAAVYASLFPGPVRFSAGPASLSFDPSYLQLSPRRSDHDLDVMLERALPLTSRPYRRDRLLANRVREQLLSSLHGSAATVAVALHVSVRSLHRELSREGTSLQRVKDEVRRTIATDALRRTRLSIKQVAERAGFVSEKSFARAFKSWTGESPSEFRGGGAALQTAP